MTTFSKHFDLNKSQPELDFVDIDPEKDIPLFLDPFAVSARDDDWSKTCHEYILSFFQTSITCIRNGEDVEAKKLLNSLTEPNETCLGFSRGRPSGVASVVSRPLIFIANCQKVRLQRQGSSVNLQSATCLSKE